jgi:hypothetical protein
LFKAMLLSIWYDLSAVKLAEALDDRASSAGSAGSRCRSQPRSEPPLFVSGRALVVHGLDKILFDTIAGQLKSKAIRVKTGTLVDATIIASASEDDRGASELPHRMTCRPCVLATLGRGRRRGCPDRRRRLVGPDFLRSPVRIGRGSVCA